jgi:hypothetical protein
MKFLIVAIFCNGANCEPIEFVTMPKGSESAFQFCERYAFGRAVTLARNYIPRTELTVQPDSVRCEQFTIF